MKDILIRAGMFPGQEPDAITCWREDLIANNSGNIIFSESVLRAIYHPENHYTPTYAVPKNADEVNERYSAFVLPLANAFRKSFAPRSGAAPQAACSASTPDTGGAWAFMNWCKSMPPCAKRWYSRRHWPSCKPLPTLPGAAACCRTAWTKPPTATPAPPKCCALPARWSKARKKRPVGAA